MKKILIIVVVCLPLLLKAQKKGDNTIVVAGVDADQMVTLLLNAGYRLETMQNEFNDVRTGYKPVGKTGFEMALIVKTKDGHAYISGKWRKASFKGDVIYMKPNQSPQTEAFKAMQNFAMGLHKPLAFIRL